MLQCHKGNEEICLENIKDIHDSKVWKDAYAGDGVFHGDVRGIALSLCMDGLNPYSKNKVNYSMWPIVLGLLNLPRSIRFLYENVLLTGIIPAQEDGKDPYNLDAYLEVLIDDLLSISSKTMFDSYQNENFVTNAKVLLYAVDYSI